MKFSGFSTRRSARTIDFVGGAAELSAVDLVPRNTPTTSFSALVALGAEITLTYNATE